MKKIWKIFLWIGLGVICLGMIVVIIDYHRIMDYKAPFFATHHQENGKNQYTGLRYTFTQIVPTSSQDTENCRDIGLEIHIGTYKEQEILFCKGKKYYFTSIKRNHKLYPNCDDQGEEPNLPIISIDDSVRNCKKIRRMEGIPFGLGGGPLPEYAIYKGEILIGDVYGTEDIDNQKALCKGLFSGGKYSELFYYTKDVSWEDEYSEIKNIQKMLDKDFIVSGAIKLYEPIQYSTLGLYGSKEDRESFNRPQFDEQGNFFIPGWRTIDNTASDEIYLINNKIYDPGKAIWGKHIQKYDNRDEEFDYPITSKWYIGTLQGNSIKVKRITNGKILRDFNIEDEYTDIWSKNAYSYTLEICDLPI